MLQPAWLRGMSRADCCRRALPVLSIGQLEPRDIHKHQSHRVFYRGGGGGGGTRQSITPAVTQMFACLFSLLGVAASSYEKYGKNSETRGISAYFFPSVMLPAVQLERLRVGACRWHRLHKRERVLCRVND